MVLLTEIVPNFKAETTTGPIDFHEYIEGSWAVRTSHQVCLPNHAGYTFAGRI